MDTTTTTTTTTSTSTTTTETTTTETTTTETTTSTTTTSTTTTTTTTTTTIALVDYELIDGFDHLGPSQLSLKWDPDSGNPTSIVSGRISGSAARFYNASNPLKYTSPTPRQTWTACFAFRLESLSGEVELARWLDDSSTQMVLKFDSLGRFTIYRNSTLLTTTTFRMFGGVWYYIEWAVDIDSVNGATRLMVSETQVADLTNINTSNSGNSQANILKLAPAVSNNIGYILDDFTLIQGFATPGEMEVQTRFVSGAGTTTQWTPSAGANWQNVDEATPNIDVDYNRSSTVGQEDLYAIQDWATTGQIMALQATAVLRKDGASSRSVALAVRTNSTNFYGDSQVLLSDYRALRQIWKENPDTSQGWSLSEVNAAQLGQKVVG